MKKAIVFSNELIMKSLFEAVFAAMYLNVFTNTFSRKNLKIILF